MLCSIWLAILTASAFYQIVRRVDLSCILFAAFTLFSLSTWCSTEHLLRWINPLVPIFSSDFSNGIVFRTSGYSRLFWFAILIGFWLISLLCVRNHGKGLFGSFAHTHKVYIPVLAILLVCGGIFLYRSEPFIDHSPLKMHRGSTNTSELTVITSTTDKYAEINQNLSLFDTSVKAVIDTKHHNLADTVTYQLQNKSSQPQDCILQLKLGFTIHSITANGNSLN